MTQDISLLNNSSEILAVKNSKRRLYGFSLIELLVVISIISVLASMVFPLYDTSIQSARHARWLGFKNQESRDPDALVLYDFEAKKGNTVANKAAVCDSKGFKSFAYDGFIYTNGSSKGNGDLCADNWATGRWPMKGALQFNGSDYIKIGNATTPDSLPPLNFMPNDGKPGGSAFTFILSIKPDLIDKENVLIARAEKKKKKSQYNFWLKNKKKKSYATLYGTVGGKKLKPKTRLTAGVWTQVAMVYDGTYIFFYKDGETDGKAFKPGDKTINLDTLIGACRKKNNAGIKNTYKGLIDDLSIYKRALQAGEIQGYYSMGKK